MTTAALQRESLIASDCLFRFWVSQRVVKKVRGIKHGCKLLRLLRFHTGKDFRSGGSAQGLLPASLVNEIMLLAASNQSPRILGHLLLRVAGTAQATDLHFTTCKQNYSNSPASDVSECYHPRILGFISAGLERYP